MIEEKKRQKSIVREYVEAIIIALVLAFFIRTFIIQAFKIPSGSMEETLQVGDYILVNKFIYRFRYPERGEIIVFKYPKDPKRDFIKRVIALPGEEIRIVDRAVYINGARLEEPYALYRRSKSLPSIYLPMDNFGPYVVPNDFIFVMGDNRDNSQDSRFWGPLPLKNVVGKALIIYWPPRRLGKLIN